MVQTMFSLFTYFAGLILMQDWFIFLGVAVCFVAVVRLFWYLAGVGGAS